MSLRLETVQALPEADFGGNGSRVEVSIVMPCLNEADTLATCIEKAQRSPFVRHMFWAEIHSIQVYGD